MKNILILMAFLSIFIYGATDFIGEKEIFIKNDKAYLISNDKEVNAIVLKEKAGLTTYSTYVNGIKTKEKILNENREVVSEYSFDSNGLISGKISYSDDYGVNSIATYENGIRSGYSKSTYYEDIDYEGAFLFGVAHGNIKFLDVNYYLQEKIFSNGVISSKLDNSKFSEYFSGKFVNETEIKMNKELAMKENKTFTGFAFKSNNGYVKSGTSYKDGKKTGYFEFENGFMTEALVYSGSNNFTEYKFLSFGFLQGVMYTITTFSDNVENGYYSTYYEDGWKFEGNFKDGKLFGKGIYYDADNKVREVHDYLNDKYSAILYFDYDKKIIEGTLKGEKINGSWVKSGNAVYYDKDGKIEEEINYTGDKGTSKIYYPNGTVKREGIVDSHSNMYLGEVKEYNESGTLKAKYNYTDGNLNGKQYYYDEKGKEIKVENYDYGNLIN